MREPGTKGAENGREHVKIPVWYYLAEILLFCLMVYAFVKK